MRWLSAPPRALNSVWPKSRRLSILQIDLANYVLYLEDTSDPSKFATDPNVTTQARLTKLLPGHKLADIVAVNGQRGEGEFRKRRVAMALRTAPTPGQAIADTRADMRSAVATFEILKSDGTPIGTIFASGLAGGAAPPGSPLLRREANNLVITGGTGAFLGARGQLAVAAARRESLLNGMPPSRRTPRTAAAMEAEPGGG